MLETILKEHGGELLGALTGAGGLDAGQAEGLIPPALGGIGEALSGGGLDLGSLLQGGGAESLLAKLDIGGIAAEAGLGEAEARGGLAALVPVVLSLIGDKTDGADGLLSMLGGLSSGEGGGGLGAIGGLAGKLFGK